ncbi:hypothetical protein VP01_439g1 [Puccinia sorghi]|uniref:Uncharacterized protein n=1 Tax=Puccinia sorghi TaxID=27349 RepID=A0A0L6UQI1_9BASI|nr:hypothetical protein VP01_439g1 [Puccinia sorghi]
MQVPQKQPWENIIVMILQTRKLFSINAQDIWIATFSFLNLKMLYMVSFIIPKLQLNIPIYIDIFWDRFLLLFLQTFQIISEMFQKKDELWHFPGSAGNGPLVPLWPPKDLCCNGGMTGRGLQSTDSRLHCFFFTFFFKGAWKFKAIPMYQIPLVFSVRIQQLILYQHPSSYKYSSFSPSMLYPFTFNHPLITHLTNNPLYSLTNKFIIFSYQLIYQINTHTPGIATLAMLDIPHAPVWTELCRAPCIYTTLKRPLVPILTTNATGFRKKNKNLSVVLVEPPKLKLKLTKFPVSGVVLVLVVKKATLTCVSATLTCSVVHKSAMLTCSIASAKLTLHVSVTTANKTNQIKKKMIDTQYDDRLAAWERKPQCICSTSAPHTKLQDSYSAPGLINDHQMTCDTKLLN